MVVDQVPVTCHRILLVVAPMKPVTKETAVMTKGKEVSQSVAQMRVCKTSQVISPLDEATVVAS